MLLALAGPQECPCHNEPSRPVPLMATKPSFFANSGIDRESTRKDAWQADENPFVRPCVSFPNGRKPVAVRSTSQACLRDSWSKDRATAPTVVMILCLFLPFKSPCCLRTLSVVMLHQSAR